MRIKQSRKSEKETHFHSNLRTLPGFSILLVLLFSVFLFSSCGDSRNRADLAERMATEEGRAEDDTRIAELKASIRSVDSDVEKTIAGVRKKADYWRLLGIKYMDYRMWGEAMDAVSEALAITPDHAFLLYNQGLCAAQLSLSAIDTGKHQNLLEVAEASYRRALVVDPRHSSSMYGLGVLLVFELSRPGEAIPFVEDYVSIERSDMNARFLLARAYLESGRSNDALDVYEYVSRNAKNPSDAKKADDLHARILGGDYDS